jgi:ATP-dependent DNA ligase
MVDEPLRIRLVGARSIFNFRMSRTASGFIEPCLPSRAEHPPSGPGWVHEIKHDGFRLMARRDPALLTRMGHDWLPRVPLWAAMLRPT